MNTDEGTVTPKQWTTHNEAHEFGAALRAAMARQAVSKIGLATTIGTSPSAIYAYREGRNLPTVGTAARIAEALLSPHLASMVVRMRTRACAACGRLTVDQGTKPRMFCSVGCQRLAAKGVSLTSRPDPRTEAIGSFCQTCEPDGLCRIQDCPLRPWSPLPYVAPTNVGIAPKSVVWTAERRASTSRRMRAFWSDPANIARRTAKRRKRAA